jgi:hypothetical protein
MSAAECFQQVVEIVFGFLRSFAVGILISVTCMMIATLVGGAKRVLSWPVLSRPLGQALHKSTCIGKWVRARRAADGN